RNQAEEVQAELERAAGLMSADGDAVDLLGRPWISPVIRKRLADELGARMELSRLGRDFLALLATQRRADHLAAIAAAYRGMLDAERGRVRARVRTAGALTEADRAALALRLRRALGGRTRWAPCCWARAGSSGKATASSARARSRRWRWARR